MGEVADVTVLLDPDDSEFADELRTQGIQVAELLDCDLPWGFSLLDTILTGAHNRRLDLWEPSFWRWIRSLVPRWKRPFLEAQRLGTLLAAMPVVFQGLKRLQAAWLSRLPAVEAYEERFECFTVDAVVSTNAFGWREASAIFGARRAGRRTVSIVNSWDNFSYKGYIPTSSDRYLVWSELMKEELLRSDSKIDGTQVEVTGAPQFDFHFREDLDPGREAFFQRVAGDAGRRMILYAASPEIAFPDEPRMVERIWKATRDGSIEGDPQLLVRTHPHDQPGRFDELEERCSGILVSESWPADSERFWWYTPGVDAIALLSNSIRYADVVVTPFSTVALDSAILDVPVVALAFTTEPDSPAGEYLAASPGFGHCRYVADSGGVRIARDEVELRKHLNHYLRDPESDRSERRDMVERICGPSDGYSSWRVVQAILRTVGSPVEDAPFMARSRGA